MKPLCNEDGYCWPAFLAGKRFESLEKHCTGVQMALGEVPYENLCLQVTVVPPVLTITDPFLLLCPRKMLAECR